MKDYEHTLSKEEIADILKRNKQARRILKEKYKQKAEEAKEAELKQKTKEEKMKKKKKEKTKVWKKVVIGVTVVAAVTAGAYFLTKNN